MFLSDCAGDKLHDKYYESILRKRPDADTDRVDPNCSRFRERERERDGCGREGESVHVRVFACMYRVLIIR